MSLREELRAMRACREGISWAEATGVTSLDELWDALCASDKHDWLVWLALNAPAVPREQVKAFLDVTVERAIRRAIDVYTEPTFLTWAERWLSGEDRTVTAARAAARAAAWAAWAAAAAAEAGAAAWAAAEARAAAAEAGYDSRTYEIRQQADWWRAQPNPFKEVAK